MTVYPSHCFVACSVYLKSVIIKALSCVMIAKPVVPVKPAK